MSGSEIIKGAMRNYAGAVIQSRALVDVRDGLKPSARQILYAMYMAKMNSNKPHKPTQKAIGAAMTYYIHGDSSLLGILMKNAQPFYMQHPLTDVDGNYGSLAGGNDFAAPRYTDIRLSPLGDLIMGGIDKATILDWRVNKDGTDEYPGILPVKGFYPLVNGSMGIAVGMAASIPPFNLKEMNDSIIKLLANPNATFDDIYFAPDFPTGSTLINPAAVKESLRKGTGDSCTLRATIIYDKKEHKLVVTEVPYGIYTGKIIEQIIDIYNEKKDKKTGEPMYQNPGIKNAKDFSTDTAKIYIYLKPTATPENVIDYLYRNTSLTSHYGINMNMLDNGQYPRQFGLKEMLESHITHTMGVYLRGFKRDLASVLLQKEVNEGLAKAHSIIDDVIKTIKKSENKADILKNLKAEYGFTAPQAEAIEKMRLGKLAKVDVAALHKDIEKLTIEAERLTILIENEAELRKEMIKDYRAVANKYGKPRKTVLKQMTLEKLQAIYFTDSGKCYRTKPLREKIIGTGYTNNTNYVAITKNGIAYRMSDIPARAKKVFNLAADDRVVGVFPEGVSDYISIYTSDKKYRSISISGLNKIKTTLTLDGVVNATLTAEKMGKKEFLDTLK